MKEKTDEKLMLEVADGDLQAYETLLERTKDKMITFLTRTLGDQGMAEEIFQEVFLRVFQARATYKPTARFSTWVFTIANNLCKDVWRKNKGVRPVSLGTPVTGEGKGKAITLEQTLRANGPDPSAVSNEKETNALVEQALAGLPEDQRAVLILNVFQGMKYSEVARVMKCSLGAVKVRAFRARRELRMKLKGILGRMS